MKQGTIKYILFIVVGLLCSLLQQASAYCPSGKFLCQSGECIPADNKCDGFNHCNDGSDEVADAGCGYTCYVCSDCEFNYATSQTCRYGCQKFVITRDIGNVKVDRGCSYTQLNQCQESWSGEDKILTCTCIGNGCNTSSTIKISHTFVALCLVVGTIFRLFL